MPNTTAYHNDQATDREFPEVRHALQVDEYSGWPPQEDAPRTLTEFAQLPRAERFRLMAQWDARINIATDFYNLD